MLVLSRKPGQEIQIGSGIVITVLDVRGDRVKLGFEAPGEIPIRRAEVVRQLHQPAKLPAVVTDVSLPHSAEVA
jgi:carbon storage regulator